MFSDSTVWTPVYHKGGWLKPPMYRPQPCEKIGFYIRRNAVEDNKKLAAKDIRHIDDREAVPGEMMVCDACGGDMHDDFAKIIHDIKTELKDLAKAMS